LVLSTNRHCHCMEDLLSRFPKSSCCRPAPWPWWYPTASGLVGLATHVTTRGTREQNRAKTDTALQTLANMTPQPKRLLTVTLLPDSYPYENLGVGWT
jgi:hypothetical protein